MIKKKLINQKNGKLKTWCRDPDEDSGREFIGDKEVVDFFLSYLDTTYKLTIAGAKFCKNDPYKFALSLEGMKTDIDGFINQELKHKIKTLENKNRETVE